MAGVPVEVVLWLILADIRIWLLASKLLLPICVEQHLHATEYIFHGPNLTLSISFFQYRCADILINRWSRKFSTSPYIVASVKKAE